MRKVCRYVKILPGEIDDNGTKIRIDSEDFAGFIREIYARREISYPKFYKMDDMSKLAFVASEILLGGSRIGERSACDEIGVILAAPHSSLDTDQAHQALITGRYTPSPAVFVYTLANIMAGEICIRNGFTGENAVFAQDSFANDDIVAYVNALFDARRIRACVCGEVDFFGKEFFALLFLVEERTDDSQDVGGAGESFEFNDGNVRRKLY